MNDNKKIDRLFQEKFKDFEISPPNIVWENIHSKLKEKKKRRVIPIWFQLSGVAAALIIGFFIFNFVGLFDDLTSVEQTTVVQKNTQVEDSSNSNTNSETPNKKNSTQKNPKTKLLQPVKENNYQTGVASRGFENGSTFIENNNNSSDNNPTSIQNSTKTKNQRLPANVNVIASANNSRKTQSSSDDIRDGRNSNNRTEQTLDVASTNQNQSVIDPNKSEIAQQQNKIISDIIISNETTTSALADEIKLDSTAIATVIPNALEELLNEKETKVVTENGPKLNRWQISSNVAPIYFSSTSNNSPIDATLAQSGKEYKADLTYGLGVRYAINNKITIRAGVNTIGMNYYTNDLSFTQTANARTLANVQPNLQGSLIHVQSRKPAGPNTIVEFAGEGRKFSSSISQRTGYIEVPIEMSYKLLNRKIGIELIGGMSTLFLNENSVSLISSGLEMEIGKAKNLNETHFSTNIGIGINYTFLKNFDFKIEPMFKYQVNTFNNSQDVNPYLFGLYTGINYKF